MNIADKIGPVCGILLFLSLFSFLIFRIQICLYVNGLFKAGHNPFARICKKCGAHQHMYRSNFEGFEGDCWWEEVYPLSNDENCRCHEFATHR